MCDVKVFLTFIFVVKIFQVTRSCWWRWFTIDVPPSSLNLVLLWQLFYLFCSSIVINTVIVTAEPLSRNESGRFGALKSDSTHHLFRNACTKSESLRFSQFSDCWLILSVYILTSFDFPFGRLFGVILLLPLLNRWNKQITQFVKVNLYINTIYKTSLTICNGHSHKRILCRGHVLQLVH
jgi:hypothetical protein